MQGITGWDAEYVRMGCRIEGGVPKEGQGHGRLLVGWVLEGEAEVQGVGRQCAGGV